MSCGCPCTNSRVSQIKPTDPYTDFPASQRYVQQRTNFDNNMQRVWGGCTPTVEGFCGGRPSLPPPRGNYQRGLFPNTTILSLNDTDNPYSYYASTVL